MVAPRAVRRPARTSSHGHGGRLMPRTSWRRYAASVATATVLALGSLAGCSDGAAEPAPLDQAGSGSSSATGDPTPSSSASPSGQSSPSESATPDRPPTLPPEADRLSRRGSQLFTRYFIDVINYSVPSLDTSTLARISADDCDACASIIRRLSEVRRFGGQIRGGDWSVAQVIVLDRVGDTRQVNVAIDYDRQVSVRRHGARPRRYPAGRTVYTLDLKAVGAGLRVAAIRPVGA